MQSVGIHSSHRYSLSQTLTIYLGWDSEHASPHLSIETSFWLHLCVAFAHGSQLYRNLCGTSPRNRSHNCTVSGDLPHNQRKNSYIEEPKGIWIKRDGEAPFIILPLNHILFNYISACLYILIEPKH